MHQSVNDSWRIRVWKNKDLSVTDASRYMDQSHFFDKHIVFCKLL